MGQNLAQFGAQLKWDEKWGVVRETLRRETWCSAARAPLLVPRIILVRQHDVSHGTCAEFKVMRWTRCCATDIPVIIGPEDDKYRGIDVSHETVPVMR